MNTTPQRRGRRLETETLKSLEKAGWRVFRQPGSGAFGARVGAKALTGDLRISAGEQTYRVECKRRRVPPLTLMGWLSGCDFLVVQADHGEATVFTTLACFQEILAAAAEHLCIPETLPAASRRGDGRSFARSKGGRSLNRQITSARARR